MLLIFPKLSVNRLEIKAVPLMCCEVRRVLQRVYSKITPKHLRILTRR